MDLVNKYDVLLVNTSGGKDSLVTLLEVMAAVLRGDNNSVEGSWC